MSSTSPCSPAAARAFMSPSRTALNGCLSFHSGCWGASAFTRSSANASWTYIGCSSHKVPSLSNTAMRSTGGTKSGPPWAVTRDDEVGDCLLRSAVVPGGKRVSLTLGSRRYGPKPNQRREHSQSREEGTAVETIVRKLVRFQSSLLSVLNLSPCLTARLPQGERARRTTNSHECLSHLRSRPAVPCDCRSLTYSRNAP